MATREFWIYQRRFVPVPWAIHVVKEYDRRKPEATMIDWTLYHEDIPTQTHSKTFIGWHFNSIRAYVDAIAAELVEYVEVTDQDYKQLERDVEQVLL